MENIMVSLSPEMEEEIERLEGDFLGEVSKEEICKMLLELGIKKAQEDGM